MLGEGHGATVSERHGEPGQARAPRAELDDASVAKGVVVVFVDSEFQSPQRHVERVPAGAGAARGARGCAGWTRRHCDGQTVRNVTQRDAALDLARERHAGGPQPLAKLGTLLHDQRRPADLEGDAPFRVGARAARLEAVPGLAVLGAEVDLHAFSNEEDGASGVGARRNVVSLRSKTRKPVTALRVAPTEPTVSC